MASEIEMVCDCCDAPLGEFAAYMGLIDPNWQKYLCKPCWHGHKTANFHMTQTAHGRLVHEAVEALMWKQADEFDALRTARARRPR